ncbi:Annexin_11 [Hexamita inflata]|uniref:Annexin 11 n=1 Tax=Hexamita inflata TaxID=28002 RepID=A0AA86TUT4_9EUKA|nr:Annexin 11 [Hexamita inflata]
MSVLMRRENTLIIEPGSDISKIQIINFILLPNSKKHFEGPPLYMRTKTTKSFTDVIDSEFTKKSLDNFTAKLAFYKLSDTETALKFIFNNSFNEATEYQQGTGGNVDKPMMNFLIAVQRDKFVLDEKMNSLLKKKFLMKTGSYDDAVKGYFGMK